MFRLVPKEKWLNLDREYSNLSLREKERLSPIDAARENNDFKLLPDLIRSLAPPTSYLYDQLRRAIRDGKIGVARCLLNANVPIDQGIVSEATLHAAKKDYSIDVFKLLLEYGWNINAQDGSEPLLW